MLNFRFGCQSEVAGLTPRYTNKVSAPSAAQESAPPVKIDKMDANNSSTEKQKNIEKGFQPKKNQPKKNQKIVSNKPPGVKRLRGKGNYYRAFQTDMRAAAPLIPDTDGDITANVVKDSELTHLLPFAGVYFAGHLPWDCVCDMWLYFRKLPRPKCV